MKIIDARPGRALGIKIGLRLGVGYERPSDLFDLFSGATYVVPASASTNKRRGATPDMDTLIWDPAGITPED